MYDSHTARVEDSSVRMPGYARCSCHSHDTINGNSVGHCQSENRNKAQSSFLERMWVGSRRWGLRNEEISWACKVVGTTNICSPKFILVFLCSKFPACLIIGVHTTEMCLSGSDRRKGIVYETSSEILEGGTWGRKNPGP